MPEQIEPAAAVAGDGAAFSDVELCPLTVELWLAWLRELAWPFPSAVLDGEAVAGDGHEGIQSVFHERDKVGGDMAFLTFDILELGGRSVMREPRTARRKRLEDLLDGPRLERVGLLPVTDDAPLLWQTWVSQGGAGIVLKERGSIYRSTAR